MSWRAAAGPLVSFARGFSFAGQGVWHAMRTQRNMRVHLAAAIAAVVAGGVLGISAADWACVALAIGLVLAAEIFNTVVEAIVDQWADGFHPIAKIAKDGAAGAVLVASLAALAVAIAVFVPRLLPAGLAGAARVAKCGHARPYPRYEPTRGGREPMPKRSRSARTHRAAITASRSGSAAIVVAALLLGSAGCSVISKINSIRKGIDANRKVIKTFTEGLKNSKAMPFQATYVTTGSSPTTVVYSVRPPHDISFRETSAGGSTSAVDLLANSSGEYSCSQPSPGAQWACQKLGPASAASQEALFGIYTPSHWITFLNAFSVAAGFAGDKVSTSTMTVNGFRMNCVDFTAKGEPGTSTICTTAQNILGYVKVASQPTSFELTSYTATPPASAFRLPPGASVTRNG